MNIFTFIFSFPFPVPVPFLWPLWDVELESWETLRKTEFNFYIPFPFFFFFLSESLAKVFLY